MGTGILVYSIFVILLCLAQIALAKAGQTREAEDANATYNEAKHLAKRVVWQAKSVAERERNSRILHQTALGSSNLSSRWKKQIKLARNVLEMTLVNCLSVMRKK